METNKFQHLADGNVCCQSVVDVVRKQLGFETMTPVQQATIPNFLQHRDVAVEACTGSGKTLAYIIPAYHMLFNVCLEKNRESDGDKDSDSTQSKKNKIPFKGIGCLIISPTRELAGQIYKVASVFSKELEMDSVLLTGGTKIKNDLDLLQRTTTNIVIGTPGRINDVLERSSASVSMKTLEVLILDEADVLLSMGFERTINSILERLPKQRRTGLFSATQTKEVRSLIRAGLRNPAIISVKVQHDNAQKISESNPKRKSTTQKTPMSLQNFFIHCEEDKKLSLLVSFLTKRIDKKFIVFFSTRACVDFYFKIFSLLPECKKTKMFSLHGGMPQRRRVLSYNAFVESSAGIMLCTDVAARGIDIPDVDWIVQYHPPQDPSFFVHRVGRTARAGRAGQALVFLLEKEDAYVPLLESRNVPLKEFDLSETVLSYDILEFIKEEQWKDRDILEKGTKAFISHIRSYKEHQLGYIFRLTDLDMASQARAFVLFRIPKLSELRQTKGVRGFKEVPFAQVAKIAFKDKNREKQRQSNLLKMAEEGKREKKPKGKEKASKENTKTKKKNEKEAIRRRKKKGRQQIIYEEWDDLAKEERLHKKLKKGQITQAEYEEMLEEAS